MDAGTLNRIGQEDAFRFARGEEVTTTHGLRAKLGRPLDFLVIADHAEMYGLMPQLLSGDPEILSTEIGKKWYTALTSGNYDTIFATAMEIVGSLSGDVPPIQSAKAVRNAWQAYTALADRYNDPGKFTALIGFEWTAIGGFNLHRNVIFRGDATVANRTLPFSQYDSKNPEKLWEYLAAFEKETGGEVLAIPHNGNLSNGRMFTVETFDGKPLTRELAAMRAQYEPLIEATQIKGDGEAHPFLSPNDEFADYEKWDQRQPERHRGEEARDAAVGICPRGVEDRSQARRARSAPTPTSSAWSAAPTRTPRLPPSKRTTSSASTRASSPRSIAGSTSSSRRPTRSSTPWAGSRPPAATPAVWATDNTREAIFDAMKRKETYATTGSRMTVRFFGGWEFTAGRRLFPPASDRRLRQGRADGRRPARRPRRAKRPTFLVAAMKDAMSGNLDRIQIVKGWLDKSGQTHEKIYDVVWSGDRKPGANGKLPPVGNTVDVAKATWKNTIGAPELATTWTDPEFDASQSAFYYARVIEIPTPRWTAYEALRFKVEMTPDVPMTTQERAYTSPIWYTPGSDPQPSERFAYREVQVAPTGVARVRSR